MSVSGFGPDQIRTLVSMVIMGKNLATTLASSFWIGSSVFLQVTRTIIKSRLGLKFGKMGPGTEELAAPERSKKSL